MDTTQAISGSLAGIEVRDRVAVERPVHEQMNYLADTLSRGEALVAQLEDRLGPILSPTACVMTADNTPEEPLSSVANNIRSTRQTAARINDRIDTLLSALEL